MSDASQGHPQSAGGHACVGGHDHSAHAHGHGHDHRAHSHAAPASSDGAFRVKDPVCGMTVDPHATKYQAEHDGHPYYFCSNGCRTKFEADPVRYVDPASPAAKSEPVPEGSIYTCPMHPEVRQVGPGLARSAGWPWNPRWSVRTTVRARNSST